MTENFETRFAAARRRYIASRFGQLNPMQREAVLTTEGPLLLLAGAGSGKTTVLIQRIANLITFGCGSDSPEVPFAATEEDLAFLEGLEQEVPAEDQSRAERLCALRPAAPWNIIAITFTNKAANELKTRLEAAVGPRAYDVWAMTFHSACCRILRREIERLGYSRSFTIYDTSDSERIMKDIIKSMGLDDKSFPAKSVLSMIGRVKDRQQTPEAFARTAQARGDYRLEKIAEAYGEYQKRLKANNAVDFDDIIFHTVTLLQQEPEVLDYYQRKFRYVLVDEYQDTNHLQYLLTSLLAGGYQNLCVVGDDDQSIYRFRGANIENILNFEEQYPKARTIRLEQNYRSTQNILDAANAVIKNNQGRKGKTLWTDNGGGDVVTIKTTFNESDEANYVAGDILMGVNRGRSFRDTAVLYRMNAQSNALEYAMKRNGIPYKVVGGMKFFDRAEVKDMLAYLCVLNNPLDDLRLRRVINNPPRGIGATTLDKVGALAESQGASLYEIIRNADLFPELKASASKLLKFADLIDGLRRQGAELALPEFYDVVCDQTGYVKALEEKNDMESRGRIENVQELKSNILGFLEQDPEDATLSGFLNEIALYTDLDSVEGSDDCITLMTIHSAKGLEFPVVYVVGMEEGIFPGSSAQYDQEELEEERRLCYVAMTRAKEKLILTNCRQRMLYGRTSSNRASRFLDEIPEENMRWESKPEPRFGGMEHDSTFGGDRYEEGWGGASARTGGSWSSGGVHSYRAPAQAAQRPLQSLRKNAAPAATLLQLQQGDMVEHTAFGKGMVLSVRPMGGDALVEVAFDNVGKKKLMLKSAGAHMRKL